MKKDLAKVRTSLSEASNSTDLAEARKDILNALKGIAVALKNYQGSKVKVTRALKKVMDKVKVVETMTKAKEGINSGKGPGVVLQCVKDAQKTVLLTRRELAPA